MLPVMTPSKLGIGDDTFQKQADGKCKKVDSLSRSLWCLGNFEKKQFVPLLRLLDWNSTCYLFECFLRCKHYSLKTNHKSLFQLTQGEVSAVAGPLRSSIVSARLLPHKFTVVYKPGKINAAADALSRLPFDNKTSSDDTFVINTFLSNLINFVQERIDSALPNDSIHQTIRTVFYGTARLLETLGTIVICPFITSSMIFTFGLSSVLLKNQSS